MTIVILDGYTANPGDLSWQGIEALGDLTVYDRTPWEDTAEIIRRIGDAQIVLVNKTPLVAEVFDACPSLRYVGVLATGYNIVDVAAAKAHGVPVCNIPSYSTAAVAQLTMALLLEICHHVGAMSDAVHRGDWTNCQDFCFWNHSLIELQDKTLGIIGYGRIGQAVETIAKAFGMNVIASNGVRQKEGCIPLEELLATADVISLHCPLNEQTQGMINRSTIAQMKDGVILLNTSRGPLLVEQDVADALNSGKIYYAGVDVVSKEPITADNPLLTAKNCFITPHIAWAPFEARSRLIGIAEENIKAFLAGAPINVVNP